jgi:ArsR family transcriptional regulator, lead/cadmium/zinc/bismuth-responsive transcriptional repressor
MDYWRNAMSGKPDERQLEGAAAMFDALSDTSRLKTLVLLAGKELSVSEIAAAEGEKMTTVSARLQILHAARLIARRRKGKSVIYSIADDHVLTLVENAVAHAAEKH